MNRLLLTYLFVLTSFLIRAQSEQEKYYKSHQNKTQLNQKEWQKIRKQMIRESRGLPENANPSDVHIRPQDVSREQNPQGDYYQYKEEKEDGEFSSYPSTEEEYNQEYSDENYDGSTGNGGGQHYTPKDHNQKYGSNKKHSKEENDQYHYGQAKEQEEEEKSSSSGNIDISWMSWLLLILLAGIVAYLIYQLFLKTQLNEKGKEVEPLDIEELEPSQIPKSELEIRLEKALAKEDYRLAIRIYFIFIIKDLSEKNWIRWEKRKTNLSYLMEMRSRENYPQFEKCVSMFEFSWYGNYTVDKTTYHSIEPTFKNFLKEIETK